MIEVIKKDMSQKQIITPISNCKIIELNKFVDSRGNLSVVENNITIPFEIKRVYYLYDVPIGSARGGHAHKELQQLIIPISGSFNVHLDDGTQKKSFFLDKPNQGLYICPMIWREITDFSNGAVCLSLASLHFDENDYYRNYDEFIINIK